MSICYTKSCLSKILYESDKYIVGYFDMNLINSYDNIYKYPQYFWKQEQEHDGGTFEGIIMFDTYNTCPNGLLDLFEEILEKNSES